MDELEATVAQPALPPGPPDRSPAGRQRAGAVVGGLLLLAALALAGGYYAGRGQVAADLAPADRAATIVAARPTPLQNPAVVQAPPADALPAGDDTAGLSFGVVEEGVASIGEPAPTFSLPGVGGQQIALADYAGSPILLNFFATWCQPCRAEMPHLQAAHTDHEVDGLVVLAVDVQEAAELVGPFMDELGLTFPAVIDADGEVSLGLYRVGTLPTSVLIDRDGSVALISRRYYTSRADLETDLRFILVD